MGQILCTCISEGVSSVTVEPNVQALVVHNLDDTANALLAQLGLGRRRERAVAQKQRAIIGLGELSSFLDGEWAHAHHDLDTGFLVVGHVGAGRW